MSFIRSRRKSYAEDRTTRGELTSLRHRRTSVSRALASLIRIVYARSLQEKNPRVRFAAAGDFSRELKDRTDQYFGSADDHNRRDNFQMVVKSTLFLLWFVASWALLVFAATEIWQAVLLAMSLGLSIAAIGMGIQHDANHGAYSRHAGINFMFGLSLDIMGVSSFIWKHKHNVIHHTYTNIEGVDFDLDFGFVARLTHEQRRRPWHRYQHIYIWVLYGLLLPKWVLFDDFVQLATKKTGNHTIPKLRARDMALFVAGKVFFLSWAIVIPALLHPVWLVLLFLALAVFTMGVTLSTVFQLAHCVGEAEFPQAPQDERVPLEWSAHQLSTTVDFARDNHILTWFLGGLSCQIEHHLFPKICHLHYPALSRIVEEVAEKHGLRYRSNRTFRGAVASHYRMLRLLGRPI